MDQRRVIELVEQFRVERGLTTLGQMVEYIIQNAVQAAVQGIQSNPPDQEQLRQFGLHPMYWFANLVADEQKEACALCAEQLGQQEVADAIRRL